MRLWHQELIPILDSLRLLDTHQSCCNLRGLGWGRKNSAVDYVFESPYGEDALYVYHYKVLLELRARGYNVALEWLEPSYCGKRREVREYSAENIIKLLPMKTVWPFHNEELLRNDIKTLEERGWTPYEA